MHGSWFHGAYVTNVVYEISEACRREEARMGDIENLTRKLCDLLAALPDRDRIEAINTVRECIHDVSPLKHHPVDFVRWVPSASVHGNAYNPNTVAPPEMKLLVHSVRANGYTMPIVVHTTSPKQHEVVDGFHRSRVGTETKDITDSVLGYLPVTSIRASRSDVAARMVATVEHNRARGEHGVSEMSEIVRSLHEAGWSDHEIEKEMGMDSDEVRRLKQVTGIAALFVDREFSRAWEPVND